MCEFDFRPRGYVHFDLPLNREAAETAATNPETVAKHSFNPFIFSVQTAQKIANNPEGGVIRRPPKKRIIAYAAHADSHIFSHYGDILSHRYIGNADLAVAGTFMTQRVHDARTAISAAAGSGCGADFAAQHGVLDTPLALAFVLVGVIAAGAYGEGVTGFAKVHGGLMLTELADQRGVRGGA